jgi:6-phosphofructokinase 1
MSVNMKKGNCIVAQSGGPTAAINASLAGVIHGVFSSEQFDTIYGSINGILGILNHKLMNLSEKSQNYPHFIDVLKTSPAMYLGSCRYKLPDYTEDDTPYRQIFQTFEEMGIQAFFYIGGNDSMDTVMKLGHYGKQIGSTISIIGIPKTIDNDLCVTDHTPGYGSAAKFVASSLLEIAHDTFIYAVKSVTIVEIMGRDAGWLTAAAALARNDYNAAPHLIYLPEVPFSKRTFVEDVRSLLETRNNVIVAVSEGIRDEDGNYISAATATADTFGHSQLSGTGKALEFVIKEQLGVKVRSIELNVLQRCASHTASLTDLNESFQLGCKAVEGAELGKSMCMLTMHRTSQNPYCVNIHFSSVDDIANQAKSIPRAWINEAGNDVTPALIEYMLPLIQGEPDLKYQDGLPVYLPIDHLL